MPDEREITDETLAEVESKPTITIAEGQGGSAPLTDSKPTITIAEKDLGE